MTDQNNRCLTMREACELIGWVNENREVTVSETRKLRRKLLSAERTTGKRHVFGGSQQGQPCWTTPRVLTELRLLPEDAGLYADVREAFDGLHDRLDAMTERIEAVATTTLENTKELHMLNRKVGER